MLFLAVRSCVVPFGRLPVGFSGLTVSRRRTDVLVDVADTSGGSLLVHEGSFFVHPCCFPVASGSGTMSVHRALQRLRRMPAGGLGGFRRRMYVFHQGTALLSKFLCSLFGDTATLGGTFGHEASVSLRRRLR